MRLYSGTSVQFIDDNVHNQIAEKLRSAFFHNFRYYPSSYEVSSWRNSLRSLSQVIQHAELLYHGIILEYQLPLTSKRLDCMICGRDEADRDNAVVIELKQWEKCKETDSDRLVETWVGNASREVLHPSVQVGQYQMYLEDVHTAFHEGEDPVSLHACAYLHNYTLYNDDPLLAPRYQGYVGRYPLFSGDNVDNLTRFLVPKLKNGEGMDVLNRVEQSRYRPNKKLMEHVATMIRSRSEFILLDEQLVIYEKVLMAARKGFQDKQKNVIIVKGGPGTGKSVIAINLMADLLRQGYNAHYATGSKSFTTTLREIIGVRGSAQFKYFNSYTSAENNAIDVLLADESHRIRHSSNDRFTRRDRRSQLPQVEELFNASKVSVFFIDDKQVVRPNEIGSASFIKESASQNNCKIQEFELDVQFRCAGSENFVNWVNNTLGIEKTANVIWDQSDKFDFKIFETPFELESAIKEKADQGFTARMTAGFCWPWSMPKADGTLIDDVEINDFRRPWNAKPEARRLARNIPPAPLWAYDPKGISQIGCIYTAQGFEFDYVGVIFGNDLVYDFQSGQWKGIKEHCEDTVVKRSGEQFVDLLKNTYRVLLTRGLKGCYLFCVDDEVGKFVKSRIEKK